jgi:hypothetical protein
VFGFIGFSVIVVFFVIILFVRNARVLSVAADVFMGLVLGGLTLAGVGAFVTGLLEFYEGSRDVYQIGLQLGMGAAVGAVAGTFFYVYFVVRVVEGRLFEARKRRHPDAPWMWMAEWERGTLVYSGRGPVGLLWTVLAVISVGLAAISYLNRAKIQSRFQESPIEVVILYAFFILLLVIGWLTAISLLRGYLKFGNSTLELPPGYGPVGGELVGTIQTRMRDIPAGGFELALECVQWDLASRGRNKNRESRLWAAKRHVPVQQVSVQAGGVRIPVAIGIPADARESDRWSAAEHIDWKLTATATIGGAMYFSEFVVPVFKPRAAAPAAVEAW